MCEPRLLIEGTGHNLLRYFASLTIMVRNFLFSMIWQIDYNDGWRVLCQWSIWIETIFRKQTLKHNPENLYYIKVLVITVASTFSQLIKTFCYIQSSLSPIYSIYAVHSCASVVGVTLCPWVSDNIMSCKSCCCLLSLHDILCVGHITVQVFQIKHPCTHASNTTSCCYHKPDYMQTSGINGCFTADIHSMYHTHVLLLHPL